MTTGSETRPARRGPATALPLRRARRWLVAFAVPGLLLLLAYWQAGAVGGFVTTSLALSLGLLAATAWFALHAVAEGSRLPLERVTRWAAEIRQGNFAARIDEDDGIAPVDDINRAAEWLEALALDKERELANQKFDIARKSRSLALLHDVAAGINDATDLTQLTARFLHTLADVVGARAASVRLRQADGSVALVDVIGLDDTLAAVDRAAGEHPALFDIDAELGIEDVVASMAAQARPAPTVVAGLRLMVVRLQYLDQVKGAYLLFVERGRDDDSAELRELLVSTGRQLGVAVEKARVDDEAILVPRMQERARLANELHDSLAQTLASLRFQVRVLDDTLHQGDEAAVWAEMERIESSLEEANTELRELIHHFRAPVHRHGLVPAIGAAVARFRQASGITTFFQNQWEEVDVPKAFEVHIVRIVSESLSNIQRHSGADNARILLSRSGPESRLLIEDDGDGFEVGAANALDDHFGLSIMHERAAQIGGELKVESEPGEGTRIILRFRGQASAAPVDAATATKRVS